MSWINLKDYCRRCGKRTGGEVTGVHTCTPNPVIEALEKELAECRKDAERYRFLRKGTHDFPAVYLQSGSDDSGWFPSDGTDIDVAIDAAIEESK